VRPFADWVCRQNAGATLPMSFWLEGGSFGDEWDSSRQIILSAW